MRNRTTSTLHHGEVAPHDAKMSEPMAGAGCEHHDILSGFLPVHPYPSFHCSHSFRHHDVQQKKATVGDGHMLQIFVSLSPRC